MTAHLKMMLILTGLTGIHSITTVSKVSVKAGGSVSIPCLYNSQYRNQVKYLCGGYYWFSCSYAVQTNKPHNSGKFSFSDDKSKRIFTVTIKDLTDKDTNYWCAVEPDRGSIVKEYFQLSVTRGTPSLYVDHQEITGFEGEKIVINCRYSNSGEAKWCSLDRSCVTRSSGSIDGTKVTISESNSVFTVTMSELRTESSGWYLCVKGDLQMPVHVTVTEKPTTTTSCLTNSSSTHESSHSFDLTSVFAAQAPTIVNNAHHSVSDGLKSYIIPLSLLIFLVMATLFIWFMLKRRTESSDAHSTQAEEEVTYSTVKKIRETSGQRSDAKSDDVDVVYSSLVIVEQQTAQKVEAS